MAEKPMLFSTEMVEAILLDIKTQTRRLVKPQPAYKDGFWMLGGAGWCDNMIPIHPMPGHSLWNRQPAAPGDIIWVREAWTSLPVSPGGHMRLPERYYYRAGPDMRPEGWRGKWKPSIHMPREAARIFLRVHDVRIERVQWADIDDIRAEGLTSMAVHAGDFEIAQQEWKRLWNSTIKPAELPRFGWDANPWVWVFDFERMR